MKLHEAYEAFAAVDMPFLRAAAAEDERRQAARRSSRETDDSSLPTSVGDVGGEPIVNDDGGLVLEEIDELPYVPPREEPVVLTQKDHDRIADVMAIMQPVFDFREAALAPIVQFSIDEGRRYIAEHDDLMPDDQRDNLELPEELAATVAGNVAEYRRRYVVALRGMEEYMTNLRKGGR